MPSQRRSIPLYVTILTVFLALLLAMSAAIILVNHREHRAAALNAADDLMVRIAGTVGERLLVLSRPAATAAFLTGSLGETRAAPGPDHPLIPYFRDTLLFNEHLAGISLAFENGGFLRLQKLTLRDDLRNAFSAPETAYFFLQSRTGPGDVDLAFMAPGGEIDTYKSVRTLLPPQRLDWYAAAKVSQGLYLAPPHSLGGTGKIGVTFARAMPAGPVVGVEMSLQSFSDFLAEQSLSANSRFLVVDHEGRVLLEPGRTDLRSVSEDGVWPTIDELGLPGFAALWAKAGEQAGAGSQVRFLHQGEDWVGGVQPLGGLGDGSIPLYLLAVAPVADFVAPLFGFARDALIASLAVLAFSLLPIVVAARMISRPLQRLRGHAEAIRDLKLDEPISLSSSIREVAELSGTMSAMQAALSTFGRFVPRDLIRRMVAANAPLTLGGEHREMTVMFCDLAGFTAFAGAQSPDRTMAHLAVYFDLVTGAVSDSGGVVDKFMGDGVMAFWNAPEFLDGHPARALAAVCACRARLAEVNAVRSAEGAPPFRVRFGLHCGEVIVGTVGTDARMDYTVIGDPVNIAARLEGLNKVYGTDILVSETVAAAVSDPAIALRPVDLVQPKGAVRPLAVFTPWADRPETEIATVWEDVITAYRENDRSRFAAALAAFEALCPADSLAAVYRARLADWPDGAERHGAPVFQATEK